MIAQYLILGTIAAISACTGVFALACLLTVPSVEGADGAMTAVILVSGVVTGVSLWFAANVNIEGE
jgi:hypothetical protein